jgi:hypothetical protein
MSVGQAREERMTKAIREKLERVTDEQKARVRAAILEARREGADLTRDRIRERAGVNNNVATVVLQAYRQGAFDVPDEMPPVVGAGGPPGRPAAPRSAGPPERAHVFRIGPGGLADLESKRFPMPVDLDGLDPQGVDISVLSTLGVLLSHRRKRAVLRFAQLMVDAELADLPGLYGEGDLDEQTEAEGLEWRKNHEPVAGEDDPALRAMAALGVEALGPWRVLARGDLTEPSARKPR